MIELKDFSEISETLWEIPKSFDARMLVPARVYATRKMLEEVLNEKAIQQLINVTTLPGIIKYALAMPDIHQGYGFPIGGVAAFDLKEGIISPGGVGYDINCGVRLLSSLCKSGEILPNLAQLITQIQRDVPSGVGVSGEIFLSEKELVEVLNTGVKWALKKGYAFPEEILNLEENGCYREANAEFVSSKAKKRGYDQLGTLGAGNHFLEIQQVVEIFDQEIAKAFGLFKDQVTIMIHTGSRGLGHQVCSDYVELMNRKLSSFKISLPNRELACAPFNSEEGQQYLAAMAAAASFAWTNRQVITDAIRNAWQRVLGREKQELQTVYDVAHNIAKLEQHGKHKYIVHRKGATRAFGPGRKELPEKYRKTGQPILIPGSMGTYSYVLAGTNEAMENTFGSTCHGAGRQMSRMKAKKVFDYQTLRQKLHEYGVVIRSGSVTGLLEEAPGAYKDIESVVDVVAKAKIGTKVAKLKPIAIVKG
jgi:tRNA-splicing ligase RtcB (3'-phosphate/5'-hydroxy nucleic acid ligase)